MTTSRAKCLFVVMGPSGWMVTVNFPPSVFRVAGHFIAAAGAFVAGGWPGSAGFSQLVNAHAATMDRRLRRQVWMVKFTRTTIRMFVE
jgi:hypothetical protein